MAFLAKGAQGQNKEGNRELMPHRASGHTVEAGVTLMPGGHRTQDKEEEEARPVAAVCSAGLLQHWASVVFISSSRLLSSMASLHLPSTDTELSPWRPQHTAQACGEGRPPPSPGAQASLEF